MTRMKEKILKIARSKIQLKSISFVLLIAVLVASWTIVMEFKRQQAVWSPPAKGNGLVVATVCKANVRESPSTASAVVGELCPGDKFVLTGIKKQNWWDHEVLYGTSFDGKIVGWVKANAFYYENGNPYTH